MKCPQINHHHHHHCTVVPEEGHAHAQLDPPGPPELVRGEAGLEGRVGGDLLHPHPAHLHLGQDGADQTAQQQPGRRHLVRVRDDERPLQDEAGVEGGVPQDRGH